jgi:hypothetical protein
MHRNPPIDEGGGARGLCRSNIEHLVRRRLLTHRGGAALDRILVCAFCHPYPRKGCEAEKKCARLLSLPRCLDVEIFTPYLTCHIIA